MIETWTYEVDIIYSILETFFHLFLVYYMLGKQRYLRSVGCQGMLSNTIEILTNDIED